MDLHFRKQARCIVPFAFTTSRTMAASLEVGLWGSISQEVQMCSWASFYQGLADEARQRAA
jgi:hypothetical protein